MEGLDRSALRSTSSHVLVDADLLGDAGSISLVDEVERHLNKVLRLREGEVVSVTDGAGRWCLASVVRNGNRLRLDASSEVMTEPAAERSVTVAAAIPNVVTIRRGRHDKRQGHDALQSRIHALWAWPTRGAPGVACSLSLRHQQPHT